MVTKTDLVVMKEAIEDPCLGHVRLHGDQTLRDP